MLAGVSLVEPLSSDIRTMSYWRARYLSPTTVGMYDCDPRRVGQMSERGLETMLQWMTKWPGARCCRNMGILFAVGGAVNKVPPDATAYVHRNANYIFEMECAWAPIDNERVVRAQREWLADYYEAMKPFVLPQSYVNFPNRELQNWAQAYYGGNLARLSKIKHKYDPHNIFKFEQSIPQST